MKGNQFHMLKRILVERRELARREQMVLDRMISALPAVEGTNGRPHTRAAVSRRKTLSCPRCDRRFAMPMHLGRHMAMTHKRRAA